MSRFPRKLLPATKAVQVVGLTARGAAWLAPGALGGPPQWQQLAWEVCMSTPSASAALKSVVERVDPLRKQRIAWLLAPSVVRCWLQAPSVQVASLAELQAVAQARALQLFGSPSSVGGSGGAWAVAAQWQANRPFLCLAAPETWAESLQALVAGGNDFGESLMLNPISLALARFQKKIPANGWLAIALAGELIISQWIKGCMSRFRSMRLPVGSSPADMQQLAVTEWQRERLRSQSGSEHLAWLCLMPGKCDVMACPELRPIAWKADPRLVLASFPGATDEFAHTHAALEEAALTAWAGQQLLEGADR